MYLQLCIFLASLAGHPVCPADNIMPIDLLPIVFSYAGIDRDLVDYDILVTVVYCEAYHSPGYIDIHAEGDGGLSLGIWQIRRQPWFDYFGFEGSWRDPVELSQLAWQIILYDIAKNQLGQQWTCWR